MGVGTGFYMYDVVVKKFTFAVSSLDEFLVSFRYSISVWYIKIMIIDMRSLPQTEASEILVLMVWFCRCLDNIVLLHV